MGAEPETVLFIPPGGELVAMLGSLAVLVLASLKRLGPFPSLPPPGAQQFSRVCPLGRGHFGFEHCK